MRTEGQSPVIERKSANHHLVHHHPDPPPVHSPAVVVVLQDLGCQILRGPAERFGGFPPLNVLFAQAKVCYLDVAVLVEQEVLQLQISFMKIIKIKMSGCVTFKSL